jgi:hypothetical protein
MPKRRAGFPYPFPAAGRRHELRFEVIGFAGGDRRRYILPDDGTPVVRVKAKSLLKRA